MIDVSKLDPNDPQTEEEMLWLRDRDELPKHLRDAIAHLPVTFGVQGQDASVRVSNDPNALAQAQLQQSGVFQNMVEARAREMAAQLLREQQQGQMNVAMGETTGRESNAPVDVTHGSNPEPLMGSDVEMEDAPPYQQWKTADLRAELLNRNLDPQGTKDELVARLEENDREEESKDESEGSSDPKDGPGDSGNTGK